MEGASVQEVSDWITCQVMDQIIDQVSHYGVGGHYNQQHPNQDIDYTAWKSYSVSGCRDVVHKKGLLLFPFGYLEEMSALKHRPGEFQQQNSSWGVQEHERLLVHGVGALIWTLHNSLQKESGELLRWRAQDLWCVWRSHLHHGSVETSETGDTGTLEREEEELSIRRPVTVWEGRMMEMSRWWKPEHRLSGVTLPGHRMVPEKSSSAADVVQILLIVCQNLKPSIFLDKFSGRRGECRTGRGNRIESVTE